MSEPGVDTRVRDWLVTAVLAGLTSVVVATGSVVLRGRAQAFERADRIYREEVGPLMVEARAWSHTMPILDSVLDRSRARRKAAIGVLGTYRQERRSLSSAETARIAAKARRAAADAAEDSAQLAALQAISLSAADRGIVAALGAMVARERGMWKAEAAVWVGGTPARVSRLRDSDRMLDAFEEYATAATGVAAAIKAVDFIAEERTRTRDEILARYEKEYRYAWWTYNGSFVAFPLSVATCLQVAAWAFGLRRLSDFAKRPRA
jgi:hypothetical protein